MYQEEADKNQGHLRLPIEAAWQGDLAKAQRPSCSGIGLLLSAAPYSALSSPVVTELPNTGLLVTSGVK